MSNVNVSVSGFASAIRRATSVGQGIGRDGKAAALPSAKQAWIRAGHWQSQCYGSTGLLEKGRLCSIESHS